MLHLLLVLADPDREAFGDGSPVRQHQQLIPLWGLEKYVIETLAHLHSDHEFAPVFASCQRSCSGGSSLPVARREIEQVIWTARLDDIRS